MRVAATCYGIKEPIVDIIHGHAPQLTKSKDAERDSIMNQFKQYQSFHFDATVQIDSSTVFAAPSSGAHGRIRVLGNQAAQRLSILAEHKRLLTTRQFL